MKEGWISENIKKMILFHHERMDGQGYPLHTKDTSIECQILALCEAFDELLCGVGCVKMKVYEAIEYIKMQRGKSFLGEIVDVLLNFVAMYPTGTKVRLSNGAIGITVSQNENFPDRPNIRLITDENGNPCNDGQVISLLKVLNLVIDEVLN